MAHKRKTTGTIFQIKIQGELRENWSDWFNGMSISTEGDPSITTLTGTIADQAALRGILNKIWDLNLALISVSIQEEKPATQ
ncbi:MAG: hypothetical protein JXA21_11805 [Anaerolineae bacterium]|nr:hypothetical protein [Anaerolineae bacterium]